MSRSRPADPVRQLLDHARALSELSRRAIELSQALEAFTGVDPPTELERLQRGAGAVALAQVQARVEEILARAEAAACREVGSMPIPGNPTPRARRLSRSFV